MADLSAFSYSRSVTLRSFLGRLEPEQGVEIGEDYWQLIGQQGVIISQAPRHLAGFSDNDEQVLVSFLSNLSDLGLYNHNQKENALWIFVSDLELSD